MESSIKKLFGKRVKELRKSKKLTQEQLAKEIGMDTQNFCKMENGSHFPQTKNLYKIAIALNVEIKDLFDYSHFEQKEELINEINNYLSEADIENIEFIYKFIKNLQQYNR